MPETPSPQTRPSGGSATGSGEPAGAASAAIPVLRLLLAAAIVLPLAVLLVAAHLSWKAREQEAWDRMARLNDLVHESVSKLFDAQLLAVEQVQQLTDDLDDAEIHAREPELHARIAAMLARLPQVRDLFVVSRDGHSLVSGTVLPAPSGTDLSDRDYYRHFAEGGTGLFVGERGFRRVDGLPFFSVAIPRLRDGAFAGVIVASMRPEYFTEYFEQAATAYGGAEDRTFSLRRGDGLTLVHAPLNGPQPTPRTAQAIEDALRGHPDVTEARERLVREDGDVRLATWRRLSSIDLVVFTTISERVVMRSWLAGLAPPLYVGIPSTLALIVITLLAIRRTRQAAMAQARAAGEMARREQAEEAVRQIQKMEALGKLTGGVAHDFNNLLAIILGSAELAQTAPTDRLPRLLDNIIHAGHRAATLTRQLLSFARSQSLAPRRLDLAVELPRMLSLLRPSLRGHVQTSLVLAPDVWPIAVDPGEFEIALLNLAVNARDAMPAGGRFTITTENRTIRRGALPMAPDLDGEFVAIALSDTGQGMPPEVRARAFEPFYTTKDIGRGTGLGLSQVYGFARQAGGAAVIDSTVGVGTCVTLFLPRTHLEPSDEADAGLETWEAGGARRVLLVEDDADVAATVTDMLTSMGWEVLCCARGHAALQRLLEAQGAVDLLVSDVMMPDGMSGADLGHALRGTYPNLPVLLISGYVDTQAPDAAPFPLLRKPFTRDELAAAIRRAMLLEATGS
ncbi:MAG: response regulator [Rhodospirillales bacterium]|nr:response regulator [Rhodospirillales bacterium]